MQLRNAVTWLENCYGSKTATGSKLQGLASGGSAMHGNCLREARRRELGETETIQNNCQCQLFLVLDDCPH